MTQSETAKIITVIMANYPAHYKSFTPSMIENLVSAWSVTLSGYSYENANKGLMRYMQSDKSGFPPSPGQIIAKMPSIYEQYLQEILEIENDNTKRLTG